MLFQAHRGPHGTTRRRCAPPALARPPPGQHAQGLSTLVCITWSKSSALGASGASWPPAHPALIGDDVKGLTVDLPNQRRCCRRRRRCRAAGLWPQLLQSSKARVVTRRGRDLRTGLAVLAHELQASPREAPMIRTLLITRGSWRDGWPGRRDARAAQIQAAPHPRRQDATAQRAAAGPPAPAKQSPCTMNQAPRKEGAVLCAAPASTNCGSSARKNSATLGLLALALPHHAPERPGHFGRRAGPLRAAARPSACPRPHRASRPRPAA